MNPMDDWPISCDDVALARAKRLRTALNDLYQATEDVVEIEYDIRKGSGKRFTATDRIVRLVALDTFAAAWLRERK